MRDRPTFKQKQFARKYVENKGNGTKTALEVYDTQDENVAKVIASVNLTKANVQKEILAVMEEKGLTDDFLMAELNKMAKQDGDKTNKMRAIDMALRVKGVYNKEKEGITMEEFLKKLK